MIDLTRNLMIVGLRTRWVASMIPQRTRSRILLLSCLRRLLMSWTWMILERRSERARRKQAGSPAHQERKEAVSPCYRGFMIHIGW